MEEQGYTYLAHALELAKRGDGHTRPNPPVGAVIVKDGKIIGEGYHKKAGTNHAETAAIADAKKKGNDLRGATIYVTLEPCSKPGRVGACTDAIIAAGLAEVYYAVADPNPTNRGRAKRVLAKAGIKCERLAEDPSRVVEACRQMIAPFKKHVTTGIPYVTVKLAMSLDGKICDDTGDAKWVSSAASRKLMGWERCRADAIMVGAETVRKDNPSLLSHNKRNDDLIRVIISRSGKLPKKAQVFTDGAVNNTLVFKSPKEALVELGKLGCMHVLCEGGLKLVRSMAEENLIDRWLNVTAPIVIGSKPIGKALRFKLRAFGPTDEVAGDMGGEYVL